MGSQKISVSLLPLAIVLALFAMASCQDDYGYSMPNDDVTYESTPDAPGDSPQEYPMPDDDNTHQSAPDAAGDSPQDYPTPDDVTYQSAPNAMGDFAQDYLNAHNKARSEAGVGPLSWDEEIAGHAQQHATQLAGAGGCKLVHLGGKYGENLAMSGAHDLSAAVTVDMWLAEKTNFLYGNGDCAYGGSCGHYTQVMWRHSTLLGCAKASCGDLGEVVSCLYFPPGNVYGEKPY